MAVSARISKSGQVTIPAEIREKLGVKPGDSVIWRVDEEGKVAVERVKYTFEELRGIAPLRETGKDLRTVIDEAMDEWGESKARDLRIPGP